MRASNVLISGAGIAGPTLAYWLRRHGFVPTLVERAPALRTGGYIIDFWGTGYDVAERMGLLPQLRPLGYAIQEVRAVASDGAHISGFSADAFRDATQGRYLSIARGDLAETIYGALDGQVEAIFGDSIEAISQDDSGIDVTLAAGGEHTVALRTFEDRLRALIERKQHAAANFAGAFAPRTAFGLFVRNLVTRAMGFAPVARLVAERSLTDRFTLPDYAEP